MMLIARDLYDPNFVSSYLYYCPSYTFLLGCGSKCEKEKERIKNRVKESIQYNIYDDSDK